MIRCCDFFVAAVPNLFLSLISPPCDAVVVLVTTSFFLPLLNLDFFPLFSAAVDVIHLALVSTVCLFSRYSPVTRASDCTPPRVLSARSVFLIYIFDPFF